VGRWLLPNTIIIGIAVEDFRKRLGDSARRAAHQSGLNISSSPHDYLLNFIIKNRKIKFLKSLGGPGEEPPTKKELKRRAIAHHSYQINNITKNNSFNSFKTLEQNLNQYKIGFYPSNSV
jgi:hypothetical protein